MNHIAEVGTGADTQLFFIRAFLGKPQILIWAEAKRLKNNAWAISCMESLVNKYYLLVTSFGYSILPHPANVLMGLT